MKNYDFPTLVIFTDEEKNTSLGVAYNNEIICLECGGVIPIEETEIVKEFSEWIPFYAEE